MMAKKSDKPALKETLKLHWRAAKDLYPHAPGALTAAMLSASAKALAPYVTIWFSARIISELAGQRRPAALTKLVLLAIGIAAALALLVHLLERWNEKEGTLFWHTWTGILTEKFLTMDFAAIDQQETMDLYHKVMENSNWSSFGFAQLRNYCQQLSQVVTGLAGAIALTVTLFTQPVPESAGWLTILNNPLVLLPIFAVMAGITWFSSWAAARATEAWASLGEFTTFGNRLFFEFAVLGWRNPSPTDIRMYRQADIAEHYMHTVPIFGKGSQMEAVFNRVVGKNAAISGALTAVFSGVVYGFVCLKAWAGAFDVGAVTQYVGAVTAMSLSVRMLIEMLGHMRSNTAYLRTAYEFMDIPNTMYQGSLTTEKRSDRQYEVEFRDVSFRYPGSDLWALRHVNLKFQVGKRLAIVGENGSGKTTFIKLLCRLYDPQEGEILLNGIDIRKYDYRDYMDIFSVVFQDFKLISQPLGDNVAGSLRYEEARVRKALEDAGFGERLSRMEDGLRTQLYKDFGQNGVEISGGEAQKLAIARALYKDAPFIILDEPTAALDPIAEAEIYEKFDAIIGDKTAIYISHRLSSCKFCDEIAVFDGGAVIQQGSHSDLVTDESGKYFALWNAQAQYYVNS